MPPSDTEGVKGWVWTAVAAALLIAAGAWLFTRREPAELRLLRSLPSGQAVYVYFDADALRRSRLLSPHFEKALGASRSHRLLADQVEAGAAAIGLDTIYVTLAAAAPEPLLRGYLADLGADCRRPVNEAACAIPLEDSPGALSVRLLPGGVIAVANGPSTSAADSMAAVSAGGASELAEPAAEAVKFGALAWIEIDAPRLAAVMRDPPEGWVNLSLIARALINARRIRLTLTEPDAAETLALTLTADADEPEELAKMLEELSRFGAAALRKGRSRESALWASSLESFQASPGDGVVEARWSLEPELAAGWLNE